MNRFFYTLMGSLLAATFLATQNIESDSAMLARKTGGAPERLQEKQQQRHKNDTQKQPEQRMARKVGGAKTRLLHRQRLRYNAAGQA